MTDRKSFDVIIIGGSYSGLAAGMALGRALRNVLIIDSGQPCNAPTPHSHNFLTQDGNAPAEIATLAKQQVKEYSTVQFFNGLARYGVKNENDFEIHTATGEIFCARKLIFATGIKDMLLAIDGFAACWGVSILHCPYCHGYEVSNQKTGILGNGEFGYELAQLISNWTNDLTLYTNGAATLTVEQIEQLKKHQIKIIEKKIKKLEHSNGYIQNILFQDDTSFSVKALYAPRPFEQHCLIPESLGCELTSDGYIKVDSFFETTVNGIFACGDTVTKMRTLANAVATGTTAGMMVNKKIIAETF